MIVTVPHQTNTPAAILNGQSVSEIIDAADDFQCPQEMVKPLPWPPPSKFSTPVSGQFDSDYETFRNWIGWTGDDYQPRAPRAAGETTKTIIINDLHIPFHDEASLKQMIETEAHDTDRLVIAGDFTDMFNWSRFPKFARSHTPVQEFREATKVLRLLSETFPQIDLFSGNHDARFMKWLIQDLSMPLEMMDVFTEMYGKTFGSPLHFISKGMDNVHIVKPLEYEHARFCFLHQFGDFVAGHAEVYSKVPNKATGNFAHWLKSFAEPIGLVKNYRCVGQAHTHQAGVVFGDYALWNFEMGCMCKIEEYVGSAKIITPRPWVKGYTRIIQDANGRTDINRSRFVHTGKF